MRAYLSFNRRRLTVFAACVAFGLSACGNNSSETEMAKLTAGFLQSAGKKLVPKGLFGKKDEAPAAPAQSADPNAIVAKALAATDGPIAIVVRIETNSVLAMNPVGHNGDFVSWRGAAGQGITFQKGVMTNTRGLGDDLMSSRIDAAVEAITTRTDASYTREHFYLGDLGQSTKLAAQCTLARSKEERVTIGAIDADATIMIERCKRDGISFNNIYWVDDAGQVLKSSQWVGQRIGSLAIQNLRL